MRSLTFILSTTLVAGGAFAGATAPAKVNLAGKPRFVPLIIGAQGIARGGTVAGGEIGAQEDAGAPAPHGSVGFVSTMRADAPRPVIGFNARALRRSARHED